MNEKNKRTLALLRHVHLLRWQNSFSVKVVYVTSKDNAYKHYFSPQVEVETLGEDKVSSENHKQETKTIIYQTWYVCFFFF